MTDNDRKIINHSITRYLATREHSQRELLNKLVDKGLNASLVKEQLAQFVEKDIQSDARYAEALIRSRAQKGQGRQRINLALKEHDIDETLIAWAFEEAEIDFFALATQVYVKKYGDSVPKNWQEKQKRMRFLQYRGFDSEQIRFALKNPS